MERPAAPGSALPGKPAAVAESRPADHSDRQTDEGVSERARERMDVEGGSGGFPERDV